MSGVHAEDVRLPFPFPVILTSKEGEREREREREREGWREGGSVGVRDGWRKRQIERD